MNVARFFVLRAAGPRLGRVGVDRAAASGSGRSPPAASGSSSSRCAPTSPAPSRAAAAAGCASTTARTRSPPIDYVWSFLDGATTAGELYGRALVVIAADRYAQRMVLPGRQAGLPGAVVLPGGPRDRGAGGDRHAAPARVARAARGGGRRSARDVRAHVCAGTRSGCRRRRRGGEGEEAGQAPQADGDEEAAGAGEARGARGGHRRVARQDEARSAGPIGGSVGSGSVREVMRTGPPAITGPGRRDDARRATPQGPSGLRVPSVRGHTRGRWNPWKSRFFCAHFRTRRCSRPRTGFSRPQQAVSYLSK